MPEKRASPRLNIRHVNPAISTPLIASASPLAPLLSPNPCLACLILLQRKPYLCVCRFACLNYNPSPINHPTSS
jgi:hypothetical protein